MYITIASLEQRLGTTLYARLTDRVSGTTASAAVAQQIVDEAEAEANALLARRFATPVDLAAHPELATLIAARALDLAEHNAWRGSPFIGDLPQRVQQLGADARRWLEAVAAGALELPAAAAPAPPAARGPVVSAHPREFTADELERF